MDCPVNRNKKSPTFRVLEHLKNQPIDSQLQSTLCSGLPSEIRNCIFQYALAEYSPGIGSPQGIGPDLAVCHDHEPCAPPDPIEQPSGRASVQTFWSYDHIRTPARGYDWVRPDNADPMVVSTSLLRTCRKIYLEVHAMPLALNEHRLYCLRGPDGNSDVTTATQSFFEKKLGRPSSVPGLRSRDVIQSLRIFAQLDWLEDTNKPYHFWHLATDTSFLQSVQHLRITLRRSDWWHWEQNAPLRINPFRGNDMMREDMKLPDGNPPFGPRSWGLALKYLPKLETLKIDFETSEDKKSQLEDIIAWAVKWRFPLAEGRAGPTIGATIALYVARFRAEQIVTIA